MTGSRRSDRATAQHESPVARRRMLELVRAELLRARSKETAASRRAAKRKAAVHSARRRHRGGG